MTVFDYSRVIVGAGYGGMMAARELGRAGLGHGTLLIDLRSRAGYPHQSTSGFAEAWIRKYDLPIRGDASAAPIRAMRLYGPSGRSRVVAPPGDIGGGAAGTAMGVVLQEDHVLANMEAEAILDGVTVLHSTMATHVSRIPDGFQITVRNEGGTRTITGWRLLLFEGYHAHLAKQLGMVKPLRDDQFYRGYEVTIPRRNQPLGEVRMWLPDRLETVPRASYHWDFPASSGGTPTRRVGNASAKSDHQTAIWYFRRWWNAHSDEYDGAILSRCGGIIPTAPPARTVYDNGAFIGGDTATTCCSVTGGGILGALESGYQCAHAIIRGQPKSYGKNLNWIRRELKVRYALKMLVVRLTYDEMDRLVDLLGTYPLPEVPQLNPLKQRRAFTRWALGADPMLFSTILTRGRFWQAISPFL